MNKGGCQESSDMSQGRGLSCTAPPPWAVSLSQGHRGAAGGRQLPALIALLSSLPFEPGGG